MKRILGLDLGTNSIGWALIIQDPDRNKNEIIKLGSRIIPMSEDILGKFDSGITESDTAKRTDFRGIRRLRERHLLRRERLHRVLNILNFLPEHYAREIDFEKKLGQYNKEAEPKIAYRFNEETKGFEFVFKNSFAEMVEDFKKHQPQLLEGGKKVPYDWTIYYLRQKALTQRIEKEELAWLLLNFNQKRGYYQLRGEEDEDATRTAKARIYFTKEIIVSITDTGKKYKDNKVLEVELQNGAIGKIFKKEIPNWIGLEKNIIATVDLDKEGKDKYDDDKKLSQRFSIPTEADWEKEWKLIKIKTENDLKESQKTVGKYIYDTLLQNPNQKINGKLVRVIERKFYKDELNQILETQQKHHIELQNKKLFYECLEELYENNESHRNGLGNKDFVHLFLDDIIFYQRPLKSKKSLISDCKYESRTFIVNEEKRIEPIKCIAKSHPLFQEFRLWQWMKNLSIYEKATDKNVTDQFLKTEDDWVSLFEWLNDRKETEQEPLIKYLLKPLNLKPKDLTAEAARYRWNFVEDKKYPCNETHSLILSRLEKIENVPANFLTKETEENLWHILYSVNDKQEIPKALKSFSIKHNLGDDFVKQFKKFPPFKNDYGAYSAKAIKKLLPLMRMGKYWNEADIHQQTKDRIAKIINGEFDETIKDRVRDKAINLKEIAHFKGLPLWLTSYIVYDRHSEDGEIKKWKTVKDLENYLNPKMEGSFKQHSLRNPIVEQVITETLRVVKDIWNIYGKGEKKFFDEIHIELGREMKNPKSDREKITQQNIINENTNLRIKALLTELINPVYEVIDVRPHSPYQQEILRLYEDGIINNEEDVPDDILDIQKKFKETDIKKQPSKSDFTRYKLWLDQGYISPYTGETIPLSRLFTTDYQIEHIIPQSRHFDDSFSNKVICEAVVNGEQYKKNQTGLEFIKNFKGTIVTELSTPNHQVKIFTEEEYEDHVKRFFAKSRSKMKKLLLEDIPEKMIERQMNDTRYISKTVKNLLSNIVRADAKDDGTTSVNVLSSNGQITSTLKQDWGLNDVWNAIIATRFERLNVMTNSSNFGSINEKTKKFLPTVPLELSKGFTKKRIDHRHHALDALVIACATRNHINYLNNQNALEKGKNKEQKQKSREDLKYKLCDKKYNEGSNSSYKWVFKKPWETFTQEAKEQLQTTIVSFKQNLRVINKTVNKYESWKDENGNLKKDKNGNPLKGLIKQTKGDSWAIRKSMHTPMPYGKKNYEFDVLKIAENVGKREFIIDNYVRDRVLERLGQFENKVTATQKDLMTNPIKDKNENPILITAFKITNEKYRKRQPISKLSNRGQGGIRTTEDALKFINKVADFKLQQDLLKHLKENKNDIDIAFSPDGIDKFNSSRKIPVYKLPIAESGDKRFPLGEKISTKHKWMEAAEGTNLFFAIYKDANRKRTYQSIPLNEVIESQKQNAALKEKIASVPERNQNGDSLIFHLSPNDLVFVPSEEEKENPSLVNIEILSKEQINRIYSVNDFSGGTIYFTPNQFAKSIAPKELDTSFDNKLSKDKNGKLIKEFCWKLQVNRLGQIKGIIK